MGWKQDFAALRQRLINKRGKSEEAFDKSVQRLATSLGLTATEALFVMARKEKVGYLSDFNRLSPAQQSRISQHIQVPSSPGAKQTTYIVRESRAVKLAKAWHERWWVKALISLGVSIIGGLAVLGIATIIHLSTN